MLDVVQQAMNRCTLALELAQLRLPAAQVGRQMIAHAWFRALVAAVQGRLAQPAAADRKVEDP